MFQSAPPPSRALVAAALAGVVAATSACAGYHNYTGAEGPRYRGGTPTLVEAAGPDTLTVVSFNVEYGEHVDRAIDALRSDPVARSADVVLLQEVDAVGTQRLAEALRMAWVYYPAAYRGRSGRDFGNAILSRWPLEDDRKIVLPHEAVFGRSRRIATAATVRHGETAVRFFSVHLATPVSQAERERRNQMKTVLDAASRWPVAVVGGDLNAGGFGSMAVRRGFSWPTEEGPRTVFWGRWDHIFVKGLEPPAREAAGTVLDNHDASDHRPVWVRVIVP